MRHRRRWVKLRLAVVSVGAVGALFMLWQLLGVHFISEDQSSDLLKAKTLYEHTLQQDQISTEFPIQRRMNLLLGSRAIDSSHYRPSKDGMFRCLLTGAQIPFERVNDDFCDCLQDGSDEPGTSACSHVGGRFYCTFHQRAGKPEVWIASGRVNDGICDCCDGSDEWKNVTLIDRFRLSVPSGMGYINNSCGRTYFVQRNFSGTFNDTMQTCCSVNMSMTSLTSEKDLECATFAVLDMKNGIVTGLSTGVSMPGWSSRADRKMEYAQVAWNSKKANRLCEKK